MLVLGLFGELGVDPEIADAPAGKHDGVVGQREDEVVERVAARQGPAGVFAEDEHQARDKRPAADRQECDPGDRPGRQRVSKAARSIDFAHARGDQHQADHDQCRPAERDRKVVIEQPQVHHVDDGEQAPPRDLRPPEQRQTVPPRERCVGGCAQGISRQNRGSRRAEGWTQKQRRFDGNQQAPRIFFCPQLPSFCPVHRLFCRFHRGTRPHPLRSGSNDANSRRTVYATAAHVAALGREE